MQTGTVRTIRYGTLSAKRYVWNGTVGMEPCEMVREELRDRTAPCGAIRSGGYSAVRCVIYGAVVLCLFDLKRCDMMR